MILLGFFFTYFLENPSKFGGGVQWLILGVDPMVFIGIYMELHRSHYGVVTKTKPFHKNLYDSLGMF